jgi:hypothetical protein
MYTLWVDKPELFEAKIQLFGAAVNKSFCRLVAESSEWNFIFKGTIDEHGKCSIPINRMRSVLQEGATGKLKLEVIAEDTYFVPWESPFEVKQSKNVTVEVVSQQKSVPVVENKIKVEVKEQTPIVEQKIDRRKYLKNFTRTMLQEGITFEYFVNNMKKKRIQNLVNEHLGTLPHEDKMLVLKKALEIMRK